MAGVSVARHETETVCRTGIAQIGFVARGLVGAVFGVGHIVDYSVRR